MTVPKPPPFDAATFQKALDENIRRPDGKPYAVFTQFRDYKIWNDKQRDAVEANRVQLVDHKKHLDSLTQKQVSLEQRVSALEDTPNVPFPASG